jgi:N-acetylglucosaminyl-diphospho-decaprenol L-rhamnosyltransferase
MSLKSKAVSVLIVSYNTSALTVACIESVLAQSGAGLCQIIVVDNNSTDGSADAIAVRFPDILLIRSAENLGFARANNLAAQHAICDLLLLLNPDTVVLEDAIEKLVSFARQNSQARIWGGRTIFADGSLNPYTCWRFMSLWSLATQASGLTSLFGNTDLFNREGYGGWARDYVRDVELVVGCFLLIERALWTELGGFDPRFFMYAEEADLCFRSYAAGAQPRFTPDATIIHYGGASEPEAGGKMIRLFRGKATFIHKHWSPVKRRTGLFLLKSHVWIRLCAFELAAIAKRKERVISVRAKWRQVWQARREWLEGYPPQTSLGNT